MTYNTEAEKKRKREEESRRQISDNTIQVVNTIINTFADISTNSSSDCGSFDGGGYSGGCD